MNNSVFGKTMENVLKRRNIELVTTAKKYGKLVDKPSYKRDTPFIKNGEEDECLIAVELERTKVMLKKPIYTGFSVLHLSKLLMYQFHYDYILPKYGVDRVKLLFTDTDSLTYLIFTEDIYKDMKEEQHLFDTSDYPKDHFLYSIENKKVIGKFKDENAGSPVMEFVGLRSKMYAMQT